MKKGSENHGFCVLHLNGDFRGSIFYFFEFVRCVYR